MEKEIVKKDFSRKKQAVPFEQYKQEFGKMPPQAIDLEEAVLGAMMLEKDALTTVIDVLKPECFYKDAHQYIYTCVANLFQKSEPVDILTVTNELRKEGKLEIVGGAYYVSQLTSRMVSSAHIEYHARIIVQKYLQRKLIEISSTIIKDAYQDSTDVLELLDKAESNLFSVTEGNIRKSFDTMSTLILKVKKEIEAARNREDGVSGVPSSFVELDRMTNGWQKTDLIIVAARPGMGKTALTLSLARNAAVDYNKPVAIFSLEMASEQLVKRMVASETGLDFDKLRKGNLEEHEWAQLNTKITKLSDAPIYIDDTPALSVFELRAKCRRLKAKHNIEMVIVDYLQLMTAGGDKGNREQEISTISRSLKSIAKELDVAVMALSQLNRSVETRGGAKRPQLSDLRESGAIEQDADMVTFIYRPEYYDITEDEDGNPTQGMAELIIAKYRNGKTGTVKLKFIGSLARFENYDNEFDRSVMEEGNVMTMPSRMNEMDSEDGDDYIIPGENTSDDEVPF